MSQNGTLTPVTPTEGQINDIMDGLHANPEALNRMESLLPPQYRSHIRNQKPIPIKPASAAGESEDVAAQLAQPLPQTPQVPTSPPPMVAQTPVTMSELGADNQSATQTIQAVQAAPDPSIAERIARLEEESNRWKSKYESEMPRFKAKADQAERDAKALRLGLEQATELNRMIQEQTRNATPTQPAIPADPRERYGFTDEELGIGDETLSVAQKVAKAEVLAANQQLIERLERIERQNLTRLKAGFETDLREHVEGWGALQDDPDFLEFLTRYDGLRGASYRTMLDEAMGTMEWIRVKNIVDHFRAVTGNAPTTLADTYTAPPTVVTPASSGTGMAVYTPPAQTQTKRTYTNVEYLNLLTASMKMHDRQRGPLLAELEAARKENRIRL